MSLPFSYLYGVVLRSLNMSHLPFNKTMNLMSLGSVLNSQCSGCFKFLIVQMGMEDAHLLMPVTYCACFTPLLPLHLYILYSLLPLADDVERPYPMI